MTEEVAVPGGPGGAVPVEAVSAAPVERSSHARVFLAAGWMLLGIGGVTVAYEASRHGNPMAEPLFWVSISLMFAAAAICLWWGDTSRPDAVAILVLAAMIIYATKILHSPNIFSGYDELLHYRTIDDIIVTGRLFHANPLLPISPSYPGLELVTHALMDFTGLPIVSAGRVVVGMARVLMTLSLFLFLERVSFPPRLAATGALIYMACPSFLFFDSAFAYESLALPLAMFCVYVLRQAQMERGALRRRLVLTGLLATGAVIVTHHVTSFILAATLLVWTFIALVQRWMRLTPTTLGDPESGVGVPVGLPAGGWLGPLAVAGIGVWLGTVATRTVGYLWPEVSSGVFEIMKIINGEATSRKLFQSTAGITAPLLERAVGLGAVAVIVGALPFGIWYVWRRQRRDLLALSLAIGSLVYPATLLLRFTEGGWDTASRATAFIYVPIAFVMAAAVEQLRGGRLRFLSHPFVVVPLATVVFAGGVIAATPAHNRMPNEYSPGAGEVSVEMEGVTNAEWSRDVFGPGHRIAADSTNSILMGSFGRQEVVTVADKASISGLFIVPGWGDYHREQLRRGDIEYVVADRRIAGVTPLKGHFWESWEHLVHDYGSSVSTATIARFDSVPYASRVFDSGSMQIYDVRKVKR